MAFIFSSCGFNAACQTSLMWQTPDQEDVELKKKTPSIIGSVGEFETENI